MTRGHVDPEAVARVSRTMALRKVAQPEDVAAQAVVLASDVLSGPRDRSGRGRGRRDGRPHDSRALKKGSGVRHRGSSARTGDCSSVPDPRSHPRSAEDAVHRSAIASGRKGSVDRPFALDRTGLTRWGDGGVEGGRGQRGRGRSKKRAAPPGPASCAGSGRGTGSSNRAERAASSRRPLLDTPHAGSG